MQMGKEDGRASREIFQEKKRAEGLPNISDHMEITILRDFSILLGNLERSGNSKLLIKQKRQGNS